MKTLIEELQECKSNELIAIGNFLLNKFEEEPELERKYIKAEMTLEKLFNAIADEVKNQYAKGKNSCMVEDNVVYGIALHIIDESKEAPKQEVKIVKAKPKKQKPVKSIDEIEMKFIDDIDIKNDNQDLNKEQLTLL